MTERSAIPAAEPSARQVEETPFEAVASTCSIFVVCLFVFTFIGENYLIPSGSMENTLLVGDHLMVDRATIAPPSRWMPLVHYREPRRGDIVVFFKPVYQPGIDAPDADGTPQYTKLVKRLIGVPGDHIHLRNGIVYVNGVAQPQPKESIKDAGSPIDQVFLDEFPAIPPAQAPSGAATESWDVEEPEHVVNGDLVVPPGMYFMMGDNRHNSLDSRYWGFVPRTNIIGRPLFNYWSFEGTEEDYNKTGVGAQIAWMGHVALHFFTDTRWRRTFHRTK
jgi:signal peptidase I